MLVENKVLAEFAELIREKKTQPYSGELKTGVDLGTANIVIAVTDSENRPVAGASAPSHVVKDGIVVDFIGAIRTVKELKAQLEERLGVSLDTAGHRDSAGNHVRECPLHLQCCGGSGI